MGIIKKDPEKERIKANKQNKQNLEKDLREVRREMEKFQEQHKKTSFDRRKDGDFTFGDAVNVKQVQLEKTYEAAGDKFVESAQQETARINKLSKAPIKYATDSEASCKLTLPKGETRLNLNTDIQLKWAMQHDQYKERRNKRLSALENKFLKTADDIREKGTGQLKGYARGLHDIGINDIDKAIENIQNLDATQTQKNYEEARANILRGITMPDENNNSLYIALQGGGLEQAYNAQTPPTDLAQQVAKILKESKDPRRKEPEIDPDSSQPCIDLARSESPGIARDILLGVHGDTVAKPGALQKFGYANRGKLAKAAVGLTITTAVGAASLTISNNVEEGCMDNGEQDWQSTLHDCTIDPNLSEAFGNGGSPNLVSEDRKGNYIVQPPEQREFNAKASGDDVPSGQDNRARRTAKATPHHSSAPNV